MALHLRHFTVRGRGEFPLDMLRYESCWPYSGEDVAHIEPSYATAQNREELAMREVRLCKYASSKRGPFVTIGRWDSFNWQVIKED
jgi:hypothetical protein